MTDYCPTDISLNPQCPHGPSLLFCRKGSTRRFYACSAFRNRKQCPFFLWENDAKKLVQTTKQSPNCVERCKVEKLFHLDINERGWCHTCEVLFSAKEKSSHSKHDIKLGLTDDLLSQPCLLFNPKEESKGESQYYFSDSTVITIIEFLKHLDVCVVLCLGCPRLHEYILKNGQMKSMLLDIDSRYFYNASQFQLFNMFNCHIFDSAGKSQIEHFLSSSDKIAIIADPPFGGRTEPLAYTFENLKKISKQLNIIEFLILPYFMEPFVLKSFPNFHMLDYKVVYTNHRKFKKHDRLTGSSKSAVRIFTNVEPSKFQLPSDEYKYCSICDRWVCNENQHCFKCNMCTSKNGAAYKHCDLCQKCVKRTWQHCDQCGICKLLEHRCIAESNISKEEPRSSNTIKRKRNSSKRKRKIKRLAKAQ